MKFQLGDIAYLIYLNKIRTGRIVAMKYSDYDRSYFYGNIYDEESIENEFPKGVERYLVRFDDSSKKSFDANNLFSSKEELLKYLDS